MLEVPCYKIVHPVCRCHRNMNRIRGGFVGNQSAAHKFNSEVANLIRDFQPCDFLQELQPHLSHFFITFPSFIYCLQRSENLQSRANRIRPEPRARLAGSLKQTQRTASHVVAGYGGFNICAWHEIRLFSEGSELILDLFNRFLGFLK